MNVGKYYVAGIPFDSENSLKHYGVKGMEWNKHKFGLDADTRFIKWINPNDINVGSYGKYGKMAEAAAKQKYGAATPHAPRPVTTYNKQQVTDHAKRMQQNMAQKKWNNSPIGKASNFVTGTANRAGKAIGTAANAVGNWAGQQAQNVGNTVGQAAKDVGKWAGQQAQNVANSAPVQAVGRFVDQNITGNTDRAAAQGYQQIAENLADSHHSQKWEDAAKRAQERADNTLFGRVGNAANAVGQAAQNVANSAPVQAVGEAARNVGNAVSGAANSVGDWVGNVAGDVKNFIDYDVTGKGYDRDLDAIEKDIAANPNAFSYNGGTGYVNPNTGEVYVPQNSADALNYFRNAAAEAQNNSLFGKVGQAAQNVVNSAPVQAVGEAARNAGNAVSGAVNAAGDWVGQQAQNIGNTVGQQAQNIGNTVGQAAEQARGGIGGFFDRVGNAVGGAANAVGDWAGQVANNVGNAVSGAANKATEGAKGFLNSAGQWVSGAANNVKSTASKATSDAKKGASGFLNSAGQWVSNAAGNVKNAAQSVGDTVGQAAQNVGGAVSGAARDAGNWANRAVNDVANSAPGRTVRNAASAVGDWASNVPGNIAGAADSALKWVGGGITNINTAAERMADDVGNWARNVPGNVSNFVDQNITGNSARAEANRYNNFAQNPNMDSVQQLMNQRAAENAQARADNTLFGRVGNAAGAVGDWARNVPGNIAGAAQGVGEWAGQAAQNVGGAISGTANSVGDWARNVPGNVGTWAGQAAQNVANAPQTIANWYTGQPNADRAEAIDRQVQNYERLGDMMYRQGMQAQGDRYHQLAANLGSVADANQARYEAAPQQRLTAAGQWIGDQVSSVPGNIAALWNRHNPFVQHSAIDEKPDGVSDAFWEKFTADGGTREDYERDWR